MSPDHHSRQNFGAFNSTSVAQGQQKKESNSSLILANLGPATPLVPATYNTTLIELELKKTFFFLYSHPLPPKFKIHDPVILDEGCQSRGDPLKGHELCLGNGTVLDLKTFTLPKHNLGTRCGSVELTDSTFCVNRDTVVDLSILNLNQRTLFYDRLLDLMPEPEPHRRIFEPPTPIVKLEIVLMEMIPISSPRLVKTIFNIANLYGGTGAALTLLVCPVHYKHIEFLEEEEGNGWKGINIIQLGREYGPEEFQEMLTSKWLSEYYSGKQVLLLHPDTMLLRTIEPSMLSDDFDIIGKSYSFEVEVVEEPPEPPKPPKKKTKTKPKAAKTVQPQVSKVAAALDLNATALSNINPLEVATALLKKNSLKTDKLSKRHDEDTTLNLAAADAVKEEEEKEIALSPTKSESVHDDYEDATQIPVAQPIPTSNPSSDNADNDQENATAVAEEGATVEGATVEEEEPAEGEETGENVSTEGEADVDATVGAAETDAESKTPSPSIENSKEEEEEAVNPETGNSTISTFMENDNQTESEIPYAPPPPKISIEMMSVGNTATGYSLRRLEKVQSVVAANPDGQKTIPEDKYWYSQMTPAPGEIAVRFSVSGDAEVDLFANGTYKHTPTGVYALWKFPRLFAKVGGRLLRQFATENIYQEGAAPEYIFGPPPGATWKEPEIDLSLFM